MLRKEHIRQINKAREILRAYENKAIVEEYGRGKFAESCKAAEASLVNVLVIARAWLGSEVSDDDLFTGEVVTLPDDK